MNLYIIIVLFFINTSFGSNNVNITIPKLESINELNFYNNISGCIFKTNINQSVICTGIDCKKFESPINLQTDELIIKTTRIKVIDRDNFKYLTNLTILRIEFNMYLTEIKPGCFSNMSKLENLSISNNPNLRSLSENLFEGLVNLKKLCLMKNEFFKLNEITKALQPKYLPSLLKLNLNDNVFKNIYSFDFEPMRGSHLEELQMTLCQIENMDSSCLNPLRNLRVLYLGQNQFNRTTIENVLQEIIANYIPLDTLSLHDAGFRQSPPMRLLELIAKSSITHLILSHNSFDNLYNGSFPMMPNITTLDLSNCLLLDIAPGTFDNMNNMNTLLLNENRLPFISSSSGFVLKQLKKLDISGNSGNQISRSYFRIDENAFIDMENLVELELSNNLITQVNSNTFAGLRNLKVLKLKNATIFTIDEGSFKHSPKLKYLNLENNQFTYRLSDKIFEGLDELEQLYLTGCSIEYVDDIFNNTPNLINIGLGTNQIYGVKVESFKILQNIQSIDLSNNRIFEYYDTYFPNVSNTSVNVGQNKIKTLTIPMMNDYKNLRSVNLEGNPFTCDCSLYPAVKWLENHNYSVINTDLINVKCVNPIELGHINLLSYMSYLKNNSNICEPISNSQTIIISVMSVFLIIIVILIILGYIYRSHVRYWLLLTKMAIRRHLRCRTNNINSGELDYKYDAFVSYSNEDQEFVNNLVDMLEKNEPHFKLCVYERDFQIGCTISESVLQSVASSRKTLLIVSDSFAKSQWCRWEAKLAEHHHLFFEDGNMRGKQGTLLMILLNEVSKENMTPMLKDLLKTRIYLEWTTEAEDQEVFWTRLRKKLSSPNLYERMQMSET